MKVSPGGLLSVKGTKTGCKGYKGHKWCKGKLYRVQRQGTKGAEAGHEGPKGSLSSLSKTLGQGLWSLNGSLRPLSKPRTLSEVRDLNSEQLHLDLDLV